MNTNRRHFFRKVGLVVAAPTIGVAKALGATPKSPKPKPFVNGNVLTAKDLNDRFDELHERIDRV